MIFTDRVRSTREGNVFSLFTHKGGGYPGQVQMGGGTPARFNGGTHLGQGSGPIGGVPEVGYPPSGYPPARSDGGGT